MSDFDRPPTGFEPDSHPIPATSPAALGTIVTGAVVALIGVGWLLTSLDVDVPWRALLPAALIVVGVALSAGARRGRHGGLVTVGILLTAAILIGSAFEVLADVPLSGGIGEERITVTGAPDDEYRWGLGRMELDLSGADPQSAVTVTASVAIGELVVIVPAGRPIEVNAGAGIGEVVVFGASEGGFGPDIATAVDGTGSLLVLDVDVAIGKVEVRR